LRDRAARLRCSACGDRYRHRTQLDLARWGLVPFWAQNIKVGFANIYAQGRRIENRPALRDAFQRRRCRLLAADHLRIVIRLNQIFG
jgi:putative SOS response-associated peptidase YedK